MAQTPPNMEASRAMPVRLPKIGGVDLPVTVMGMSQAMTNIIAALALDPGPLVTSAHEKSNRVAAGQASDSSIEASRVLPGILCSAVTAELVPLLQPIIFSSVTDQVFGSTAGLSQREEEQLKHLRRMDPRW
jgi:hypothetical protein